MKEKKIIVAGTIFLDIKGYPLGEFHPTACNPGRIEYKHGGVGRNVADNLAGMGLHPVFLSIADQTGPGESVVRAMQEAGIITDHILRMENGIGTWMVILNENGEICANLSKRQDLTPLCEMLAQEGDHIFAGADGILLEMDVEEPVVEQIFSLAQKYEIDVYGVISNMPIAAERLSYIQKCRVFICNKEEAGFLFGEETTHLDQSQMISLMQMQMDRLKIPCMVVTMDKDGAVFVDRTGEKEQIGSCPAETAHVVDSTGAGDAFFTGVAAGLIYGKSLETACKDGAHMAKTVLESTENVYRSGTVVVGENVFD